MASDRIFGLVALVVALGFIFSATQLAEPFLPDPMGGKAFPYIVGGVAALCAISMILSPDADPAWPSLGTWLSLGLAVIVLIGYAYTLKPMGFLIPTALAAGILSYQISPRPVPAVLTGLGLSVGLFFLFKYALGLGLIPFPKGWMG